MESFLFRIKYWALISSISSLKYGNHEGAKFYRITAKKWIDGLHLVIYLDPRGNNEIINYSEKRNTPFKQTTLPGEWLIVSAPCWTQG